MDKFERYWKLSEMEERYNSSSAGVRGLASAWLLGSLGTIGWLFHAYNHETWPFPLGFLVVVVTTLGCGGMITLWVLDQLVFHRLLNSVFLVGLKLEKDDNELPPIRSMMMKTQEGAGAYRWEIFFYMTPIITFLLISLVVIIGGSNILFTVNERFFSLNTLSLSIFLVMLQFAAVTWMLTKIPSMSLKTKASYFEDQEFLDIVAKGDFDMIIARFRPHGENDQKNEG